MLKLTVVNLNRIIKAFTRNYRDKEIAWGMKKLSKNIFGVVKAKVPVKTGALKNSLGNKKVSSLEYHHIEGVPHGKLLRSGSPRHEILPRRPKYALWWRDLPHPIVRVNHPGFKKVEYNVMAVNDSQGIIDDAAAEMGTNIGVRLTDF